MAVHDKILAVLALELGSLGRDVSCNDGRIIPIGLLQRGGEHVLTDVVEPVGVRAALRWPHNGEDLVGPASHQHRVAVREYAKRVVLRGLIEIWHCPKVWITDYAIDGHESTFDYFSHGRLLAQFCSATRHVERRGARVAPAGQTESHSTLDFIAFPSARGSPRTGPFLGFRSEGTRWPQSPPPCARR